MVDPQALWPGWETVKPIGKGGFGTVYEIRRSLAGYTERAALKVITIPQGESEIEELLSNGFDRNAISQTYTQHMNGLLQEYTMMRKLGTCPNIVNCDDVRYERHEDGIGWDIYIKMELLIPLRKAFPQSFTEQQVLQAGKALCNALVACKQHGVLHRDIKPQNIFVSPRGVFKLGDFGVAKNSELTAGGTKIGTYKYMAPEVYNNQPYGSAADLYSLGLVLYWMLNDCRMPFMPPPPAVPTYSQDEEAKLRRLQGEPLPPPTHGSEGLKAVVLKACAYNPADRFESAAQMLAALEAVKPTAAPAPAPISPVRQPTEWIWAPKNKPVAPKPERNQAVAPTEDPDLTQAVHRASEKTVPEPIRPPVVEPVSSIPDEEPELPSYEEEPDPLTQEEDPLEDQEMRLKRRMLVLLSITAALLLCVVLLYIYFPSDNSSSEYSYEGTAAKEETAETTTFLQMETEPISAGYKHTVGLKADGTVVAVGWNFYGQCDVEAWQDMVAISAGSWHTVGLKADGTVVAVGDNEYGQCDVEAWQDIVAISAGYYHTVGLKADGTVVAVGWNEYGRCDVEAWQDIVAISAGNTHTVGLKADGTVVAVGGNGSGKCDVEAWQDIVAVSVGSYHTVGLKADGTVVAVGDNYHGQCDVEAWQDMVAISAGNYHTVGLKADGTVVAVGYNNDGRCDVDSWILATP